ncbi:MAG: U32 family peptidase [Gammaproteobacteria bacterium]|nr:MAG: U32 family peptidase [Gammaproteobacteria bacterium]
MRLSIGPIQYYWTRQTIFDFYDAVAETSVDILYLGEVVCSKRRQLKTADWVDLAKHLTHKGKQVVLSTLTLIEAESELKTMRRICRQEDFMVEANDMGAVQLLTGKQAAFVTGPFINIYNDKTLACLVKQGLKRWVMPVELSGDALKKILNNLSRMDLNSGVETEVYAYGRLPLAFSARCFTARAHSLAKDNCEFICGNYPDGLEVNTQEKQRLFSLNGIQTQSGDKYNLIQAVPEMQAIGVDIVRLNPQLEGMVEVVDTFSKACSGESHTPAGDEQYCNGYWYSQEGLRKVTEPGSIKRA